MENIEIEASKLEKPDSYKRKAVPYQQALALPAPRPSRLSFWEALKRRRSADSFLPLSNQELSNFLYDVASRQQLNSFDHNRERRYVPSMGALHPAHLVLFRPQEGWFVYLADRHSLGVLGVNEDVATLVRNMVREHFQTETATLLYLLSDCELAANYYLHYVSLLFKDAGVLLGHASLVAAAHDLAFRILGRNGSDVGGTLIPGLPFRSLPCGLALLGESERFEI
jgi:hypothetical protein